MISLYDVFMQHIRKTCLCILSVIPDYRLFKNNTHRTFKGHVNNVELGVCYVSGS